MDFREAIAMYYDLSISGMAAEGKKDLPALDTFWRTTLPGLLRERQNEDKEKACWLTKAELVQVMKWKLTRGKMRPLMNLVQGNDPATVKRISKVALTAAQAGDIAGAITLMSGPELKGIGPATASAVLAAYRPELFPFMADEPTLIVLGESGGGKLKYNLAEYLKFQKAVVKKCNELDNAVKGKKNEISPGEPLTADEIGRALWCVSKAAALGKSFVERSVHTPLHLHPHPHPLTHPHLHTYIHPTYTDTDTHTHTHTHPPAPTHPHTHTHTQIYIYIYICKLPKDC